MAHLFLGELVRHGVAAITQRRVRDAQLPLAADQTGHDGTAAAAVPAARRCAMTSPTCAAAAVMMVRVPADSGRGSPPPRAPRKNAAPAVARPHPPGPSNKRSAP